MIDAPTVREALRLIPPRRLVFYGGRLVAESRLEKGRCMPEPSAIDLLIERGVVLPMTGEHDLFWDGAVAIDDGRIMAVGATADLREAYDAKETIDARDQLVMPGLVNTHMHLFGAFARGLVNDLSFTPWIQKKFYVTSKGLNPDNYYLGTQFTSIEMLKTGTTAFLDCGTYQELEEAAVRGVETAGSAPCWPAPWPTCRTTWPSS